MLKNWNSSKATGTVTFERNTAISGRFLKLIFAAAEGTETCEVNVACSVIMKQMDQKKEKQVPVEVVPCRISITSFQRGDVNGDGEVNSDDAIYTLYYTMLPDSYPVNQSCDFNGDGEENSDDAIYLLYNTLLPEAYPLV